MVNGNNHYQRSEDLPWPTTEGVIRFDMGILPLMPGRYSFSLWFGDLTHNSHIVEGTLPFEMVEYDAWGNGKVPPAAISYLWWPTVFTAEAAENN